MFRFNMSMVCRNTHCQHFFLWLIIFSKESYSDSFLMSNTWIMNAKYTQICISNIFFYKYTYTILKKMYTYVHTHTHTHTHIYIPVTRAMAFSFYVLYSIVLWLESLLHIFYLMTLNAAVFSLFFPPEVKWNTTSRLWGCSFLFFNWVC